MSVDGIADEDWHAGATREEKVLNGPGGAVVSRTVNTPWASGATATRTINGDTVTARFTGVGTVASYATLDAGRGERVTKTVTSFDEYGMPTAVDDLGQDGVAGDEQCTRTDYVRDTAAWILDRVQRVRSFAVKCADTGGTLTDADVFGESRLSYDGQAYGTAPTKGLVTQTQEMAAWSSGAPTFTVVGKAGYDVHGRVTSTTDAMTFQSTVAYTPAADGPVTSTVAKNQMLHQTTTTLEPAWGLPTATVDANGKRTDVTYDPFGRTTAVWTPGRVKGTDPATTKYSYDLNVDGATAVSTSTLNPAGAYVTSYKLYDGLLRERQTQAPSPSGGRLITENFYDTAGRATLTFRAYHTTGAPGGTLQTATDKAFVPQQNRSVYDGAGRITADVFQPYGAERWRTSKSYTGDRTDVTPPTGGTATSTVTDSRGRTVELRQYHGATPTPQTAGSWDATTYTYDRRGYQSKVTDALGNDWAYAYDVRGRQTEVDDPDKGKATFTYDNAGQVLTSTDARGKKIAYLYDPLGRKRAVYDNQVGGTLRAQWIYDTVAKGYLSQSTRMAGSAAYQTKILDYNDRYQPGNTQVIIPASETGLAGTYNYNTTYNPDGSTKSSSIPGTNSGLQPETLTYGYNALGAATTLDSLYGTQTMSYVAATVYNALGELDQVKLTTGTGGNVFTSYTHELETGRLTGIRTDRDAVAPYTLFDTTYQYDPAGNITKVVDAAPDPTDDTQCFTYDHLARLTDAWTPANGDCTAAPSDALLGGPAAYWNTWKYNAIGNRTQQVVHSATGNATTDYAYPQPGSTAVRPHAVTATSGAGVGSYTYDDVGNMLTRPTASSGTQTLTWDAEGHVETSTDASGQTTYIYDADGNRLVRRDPTGRTLYLPGQEIRYTTGTAATSCTRYYTFAGSTVASRNATALTWLSPDHQGTASIAVDVGTQQATVRRQTPFGTPRGAATTWPNDKGFVGGTNDNTGLTHIGAREYDPGLGRFVSVDPVQDLTDPQQWNAYAYASNSPVTASDATGLCDTDACYGHQLGLDDRDKPASGTSGGDSGGSSKTKCKWDCISKKKAPHAGVPVRAMRTLGYNGSDDFTYADALRWAELSENGYLLVCMHTFNRSDDDCHENDPWTKAGPLTKKEALGLIAMPVVLAGIGVGAECVTVYFLCAIAAGQVGRMTGGGILAGLGGEGGEAPMPQAQLGRKLEYFFGNATGKQHNIQRSGDMVMQLNRIGIQDNARGRAVFENHLRSVFADPDSVVAIQDNGYVVREVSIHGWCREWTVVTLPWRVWVARVGWSGRV